jgi:hypothetical protein
MSQRLCAAAEEDVERSPADGPLARLLTLGPDRPEGTTRTIAVTAPIAPTAPPTAIHPRMR